MPTTPARALLLGLASGARSTLGTAAVSLTTPERAGDPLPLRLLTGRRARRGSMVALAGELVGDLLPQAPSRLQREALVTRVLSGAACGIAVAQHRGERVVLPGLLGAAGAVVGAQVGARARAGLLPTGVPGALIEDVAAVGVAYAAVRL